MQRSGPHRLVRPALRPRLGIGAADFVGNELPVIYQAEQLGLDVTYWTDVDLHAQPQLLDNHRALVSLGHDEYWSRRCGTGRPSPWPVA
jgi:hypothetical protein